MKHRWATQLVCGGFLLLVWSVLLACAATPLDGMFASLLGSLPLWGQALVGVGGILLAIGILTLLHAGPMVIMTVLIGFAVLLVVAMASSGQLFAWLTSIGI